MKRFKATWFFAVVVIALGAYVFWDFTEQKRIGDLGEGEQMLTEFAPSDVQNLKFSNQNSLVALEFKDGKCRITQPIEDLCDMSTVQGVLNALTPLKGRQVLAGAQVDSKISEFGLEKDEATQVSWTLKNGQSASLDVGSKNTFDGSFYVLKDNLFVVDRAIGQLTNKGLAELRSKELWRGPENINHVSSGEFKLIEQEGSWRMEPPAKPFKLDEQEVKDWIQEVKSLTGTKVFDEKPDSLANSPEIKLNFNDGSYSIELFESKDVWYGKESSTSRYIEIPQERLRKIIVPASYFYSGTTPFQFPLERVGRLSIQKGDEKFEFKKADQKWVYEGKKEGFREDQLPHFFQSLKDLEAKTFESSHGHSFSQKRKITMFDSEGKKVFEMVIGEDFKPKKGPFEGESLKLVRVDGFTRVFSVSKSTLDQLMDFSFFEGADTDTDKDQPKHDHNH